MSGVAICSGSLYVIFSSISLVFGLFHTIGFNLTSLNQFLALVFLKTGILSSYISFVSTSPIRSFLRSF